MDSLLVVGVDTVAGANLAASLSDHCRVSTWAPTAGYEIANCDALDPSLSPEMLLQTAQPNCMIYCGPAARSAWEPGTQEKINDEMVSDAETWSALAAAEDVHFVMITSDAVFTGPWMFHDENSHGLCTSYQAQAIRAAEHQVMENCPSALIIRTNAFGWSAGDANQGWIENLLKNVETKRIVEQDHVRHATPILATDLAEIVKRAILEELTGIYHVAGAERVSPLSFTQRLADRFELPWLAMRKESTLSEAPHEFSQGECSLQTKQIRKALCVAMPLLSEGLTRLFEQAENGYREKLRNSQQKSETRRAA